MPWNNNVNPGPWGSSSGGDGRGGPPPRRPDMGPDFDRIARRLRSFFTGSGGGGIKPAAIAAIVAGVFALWALSGLYIVQPNEQAVVTTFGAYTRNETPGLRYHMPAPFQQIIKVPVTTLQRVDVGGVDEQDRPEESLMLTGDGNIIDLDYSVTWRISDPDQFVFTIRDPEPSVKAVAESAMREIVGRMELDDILTTRRGETQLDAAALMQTTLDSWGAGVSVVEVQIRNANPPAAVLASFRDVQSAEQDKEAAENQANTYANRVVNEAEGDAARITESASAYREQAVREANGDTARFNAIYSEYGRAPGATRDRLYIETMQRVLARSNKVIIDTEGSSAPIILPPDVFRPRDQVAAAPVAVQAPITSAPQ